ncbi:MAG TPA: 16S rRNA (guanine(966)-N(2))-methyltransferase RsmD [Mycobacteriales bacterium]|nr:16S rRNA (guanine(966)-N(2))-methyltransferase RsmD [Mycobacteriales bacterium]
MVRIIAGAARGRRLAAPAGRSTRPTSDRTREGLFSTLESLRGGSLAGARFLDLYAGSGAVGLEALSRGAASVTLVESDARATKTIRDNVKAVGLPGAEVVAEPVERVLGAEPSLYDVVFADPPYDDPVAAVLETLVPWLAADAVIAVERASREAPLVWPAGIEGVRERRYGDATLWYGRRAARERA